MIANNTIVSKINMLEGQVDLIPKQRIVELDTLAGLIISEYEEFGEVDLLVICTHNSRRSQLAQLWIKSIAQNYNLDYLKAYSGGTEVTAFNVNMVNAIKRYGFSIEKLNDIDNAGYLITQSEDDPSTDMMFSKLYDDEFNPEYDFIAILVCSEADEACPVIEDASHRVVLPYEDPKKYDGTPEEGSEYTKTIEEIGREMIYMIKKVFELQEEL